MCKIVLLAINARYIHSSLSVWALAGGISNYTRSAVETTVVEATINQSAKMIVEQVIVQSPTIIGISTYIWNANLLPEILNNLHQSLPQAVIVLGGPEASFNAEHWISHGADYVIRGEGERSFPALVDALIAESSLANVPGLCRLEDGKFNKNREKALQEIPTNPYSVEWFSSLKGRIAYLETSRGCPFSCAFCLSGQGAARFFSIEYAKRQLSALSLSGAKTIKLVDRTFNCDPDRAYILFDFVINMDTDCCFHFEVAADMFNERVIALLETAPPGRIQLEAGLQSFFEPTLHAVSRRVDIKKLERNIHAILFGENIHIHIDLIAGLPLETFTEFQNSFNRAYALGAHKLQLGFLKLLHGSVLRAQAKEFEIEFSQLPPYEIISNAWISAAELEILHKAEDALEHTYNSGRFLSTLSYVLTAAQMNPFDLYCSIGEQVPHNSMALTQYAQKLYEYFCGLPGVCDNLLRDTMVCDILAGAKGTSFPPVLRVMNKRHNLVAKMAADFLGHTVSRRDTAVMVSRNQGVFAGDKRNRVTELFELFFVELPGH